MSTIKNNDRLIFRIVLAITLIVFAAVIVLNRKVLPRPEVIPSSVYILPKLNAFINAACSILLIISYSLIRKKKIEAHKTVNIITFFLSAIFLVSYVTYHYLADETIYPSDNPIRPYYLMILVTHILLAAGVLPLILLSFYYGLKMNVITHRKLTRWSFPIWLYVTISGVIVYLMISPYYPITH